MAEREVQRRLAAILAADVAGYTRLMEDDTDGTVAAWQDAREEVIKPQVADHSGTIVKLTGDGFLVEFATVQDAVNCAIQMQSGLAASSLKFRIGINLGDIVDDGEDIHGEGVNVAARLEGLAEPGGICISGMVYDSIRNRIDAVFEDMGEQTVKNVSEPVHVYAIRADGNGDHLGADLAMQRPAVAVLPFDNMLGDTEQEYFVDGLTEDIITALTAWRSFPVIGRNSTFTFKGKATMAQDIAKELNARYILEGSVRKSGDRVRITGQLLDAETGHHIWAERYDRNMSDIFDLQDEISERIVTTLVPELENAARQIPSTGSSRNLGAWDYYLRGMAFLNEIRPDTSGPAREMFEKAIEIEPEYAQAHARIALTHHRDLWIEVSDDAGRSIEACLTYALRAVELDEQDCLGHWALGLASIWQRNYDKSLLEADTAIRLNPTDMDAYFTRGVALMMSGSPKEAIPNMLRAVQFNPLDGRNRMFFALIARAFLDAENYDEALNWGRQALLRDSNLVGIHYTIAAAHGYLDDAMAACKVLEDAGLPLQIPAETAFWWTYQRESNFNALLCDGLRKAGIKEPAGD